MWCFSLRVRFAFQTVASRSGELQAAAEFYRKQVANHYVIPTKVLIEALEKQKLDEGTFGNI